GEREREAHEVEEERLQGEYAVEHAADTRQRQQASACPASRPAQLRDLTKDADGAEDDQQPADDERRIHDWTCGPETEAAQGLADRRVRRDSRAPEAVTGADEAEDEPGQRQQDRAGYCA